MTADSTPRPTQDVKPSSESTLRPTQDVKPSSDSTPRPTQDVKPSSESTPRPTQDAAPSGDPTRRPPLPTASAHPTARPTRRPAASTHLLFSRTPAPTPYPLRSRTPAPRSLVALEGILRFYNANATLLNQTEVLQQIVANLACALRLPFEQIQIKNITKRFGFSASGPILLPFNPALLSISSNGEVICFVVNATARRLRANHRMLSTDTSIDITYIIIDPAISLLSMNSTEFSTTIAGDPVIQALISTVQGTGVEMDAPPELAMTTETPVNQPAANSTIPMPIVIGVVVAAIVVGGILAAGIFVLFNKKGAPEMPSSKSPSVVYIQSDTPQEAVNSVNPMATVRTTFTPQVVRNGTRV